ncbi:DUF6958 family protein [Pelagibacterium mangrovi]|uniref:DUF6958 family protein n=1 Tax=Pelagibacterium mangrovi TaxID=3119828 RepID=UPI002FCA321E
MSDPAKIEIENVMSPGRTKFVDRQKYEAVRDALLAVLPRQSPGMTEAQARQALMPHLPEMLFPGGDKLGWWLGAVRLDLEAKGVVIREDAKPKRYHQAG